jgi:hypothetical protein
MAIQKVGAGSAYAAAFVDAKSQPLDGGKTYKLHLPAGIPAKQFWSLVLYDTQTRSMLQTDQPFPSIGSQKKGVAINPDTSVDIYFGPTPPSGKESQRQCELRGDERVAHGDASGDRAADLAGMILERRLQVRPRQSQRRP